MDIMKQTEQLNDVIRRLHAGEAVPNTEILQALTWLAEGFSTATNAISDIRRLTGTVFAGLEG